MAIGRAWLLEIKGLREENERLRGALIHVRKIISEGAETGFNCRDGDWAEHLFASQALTHAALTSNTTQENS